MVGPMHEEQPAADLEDATASVFVVETAATAEKARGFKASGAGSDARAAAQPQLPVQRASSTGEGLQPQAGSTAAPAQNETQQADDSGAVEPSGTAQTSACSAAGASSSAEGAAALFAQLAGPAAAAPSEVEAVAGAAGGSTAAAAAGALPGAGFQEGSCSSSAATSGECSSASNGTQAASSSSKQGSAAATSQKEAAQRLRAAWGAAAPSSSGGASSELQGAAAAAGASVGGDGAQKAAARKLRSSWDAQVILGQPRIRGVDEQEAQQLLCELDYSVTPAQYVRHLQEAMAKRGRVYIEGALLEHLRPHLLSPGEQWCAAGTVKLINQKLGDRCALRVWFEVPQHLARQLRFYNPAAGRYEALRQPFEWRVEGPWLSMSLQITELHGHLFPDRPATRACLNEL